jgi:7-alpha-hydroxysteroid dehydrogenase
MLLDRFSLTDKVAIVTGAGRGIGAACALGFAEAGADVVIASRTKEQLEDVAFQVSDRGRRALGVPCDVNETANLELLVDQAMSEFGRIDIVVNNAGGSMPGPFLGTSEKAFEGAFHFNVTTAFTLSKLAVPHMLAGDGGSIVNISSIGGKMMAARTAAYAASKAGIHALTCAMASELGHDGIRVNAICPGIIDTYRLDDIPRGEQFDNLVARSIPLGRAGAGEDIGWMTVYLCSDQGSWITGQLYTVDGGTLPGR